MLADGVGLRIIVRGRGKGRKGIGRNGQGVKGAGSSVEGEHL